MDAPILCTIGELLVEFISHEKGCGLRRIADYSGPYPSGAPAIFLDQAARMRVRTWMIGGLGDDGFGQLLRERLRQDHVGIEGIETVPNRTTGTAFVSYYDNGARDFIFHLENTAADGFAFDPGSLPEGDLVLHVSAASLGSAPLRQAIMQGVEAVLARGGRITCDPNARPELLKDTEAREALETVIAQCWCLMPSTSDLGFLYPDLSEEAAIEKLLTYSAEIVAVKRGAGGATIVGHGERHDFPAHAVTEIDPTGAGDGFCGTLVALLLKGHPLAEAGRLANAAGAIAVTRRGPMEGNSSPDEIAAFLSTASKTEGQHA